MAPSRADDEELRALAWSALYDLFLEEHRRRLDAVSELGVSPGDLKAMMALEPGRRDSMRALADRWHCDASTVTWIVDRLEKRGLVERHAHERDRRVKAVALSSRGEELRAQLLDDLYRPPSAMAQLSRRDLQALRRLAVRLRDQASK
jgi:DNA-binding MarR family transcriptional regulator